ncbi:MAG: GNAT family N-acetyltransferase, partial [Anaerolineae bacterium]|nr:GNAT family N-acetyltransferase [Anaerolineae bacterium]
VYDEAVANLPGLRVVSLWVFGDNEIGQNLYRKLGYVEYGRLPGGVLHRGAYVDMVFMAKTVNR